MPAAVGVPLSTPFVDKEMPGGSAPPVTDHVMDPAAQQAPNWFE